MNLDYKLSIFYMTEPEKLTRYNILRDFSTGLEATPVINYAGSQIDLTDEQAKKWADYIEIVPGQGDATYVAVKRGEFDGRPLVMGERLVLSPGEAKILGESVVSVESQLDEDEQVAYKKETKAQRDLRLARERGEK